MSSTILGSDADKSPIYFWREYDEPYGFLSQWYDCAFQHEGVTYRSAEMWMMVQKAKLFGDTVRVQSGMPLKPTTHVDAGDSQPDARNSHPGRAQEARKESQELQSRRLGRA